MSTAQLINMWQQILRLRDWQFRISAKPPENPFHQMECVTNLKRQDSAIRIKDHLNVNEAELVHEMLHPIFEPIRYEHKMQMRLVPANYAHEYEERITHEIEKAVDHIAKVLYDLRTSCLFHDHDL